MNQKDYRFDEVRGSLIFSESKVEIELNMGDILSTITIGMPLPVIKTTGVQWSIFSGPIFWEVFMENSMNGHHY